jgi:uncharacterized protein (TIRG00374 family)
VKITRPFFAIFCKTGSHALADKSFTRYYLRKQVFLRQSTPMPETKKTSPIFLLLRIAVVAAGITFGVVWLSREQRWQNLVEILRQLNIAIFALALCIFVISQVIIALRWWLLLRTQSIFIDFWASVKLYFLGWFYNNFMPSSVGGDLIRAWYVTRHTDKKFQAVLSVFVDRIIGLSSTLIIAVFFYSIFLWGQASKIFTSGEKKTGLLKSIAEHKSYLFWLLVVIAALFCVILLHRRGRAILQKAWSSLRNHSLRMIKKLKDAIILYCRKPLVILQAFGLTVFLQLLTITGFWFLGTNLGIEASIKYYYVFFTLTWVLGAVPVSIGGAVVVEGLLAYMFIHIAGVQAEAALALALCQRIVWMLASLPGAAIHLMGAHLPKDFFIDYD